MKVAMIGHKVVPSRRGGIERVLTVLCPLLAERGAQVVCYNRRGEKIENEYVGTAEDGSYQGVRLKWAPTMKVKGISAVISSFTAAIAASFGGYDVIHFHAEGPCAAMWIPKLLGKRCIATVHGLDWQREKWGKGFASRYIHFGEKVMVRCADEIIVLSEPAREYFRETYGRQTHVIPNGTARPRLVPAEQITERFGLEKDSYICVVSRLTEEKGIHLLIEAYQKLKTDKKLVIAGDASDTDSYVARLKEMAAGNENILFTGFISGQCLEELYSNAYAACLPSYLEGMSLSLLEALSYGNAVVCSDIPENICVAEDHAVYFRRGDREDLAQQLQKILDEPTLCQTLKDSAADFICEKYAWDSVADDTYRLYLGEKSTV